MNDKEGVGAHPCPICTERLSWVDGTSSEIDEFRQAIQKDPDAYKKFYSSEYRS
jgi:hypothetical protein